MNLSEEGFGARRRGLSVPNALVLRQNKTSGKMNLSEEGFGARRRGLVGLAGFEPTG